MDLTSFEYLAFLLFVVAVFYAVLPKYRIWLLITAGYAFYSIFQWQYSILLFGLSTLVYALSFKVNKYRSGRKVLLLSVLCILLPLIFFKYYNFLIENIRFFDVQKHHFLFPIGISFFTFQMISYLVDIRRGYILPEKDFSKVLLHFAFFPILLAGPIERAKKLLSQFDFKKEFEYENFRNAMVLILWGIFKKIVIANNLAFYVHRIQENIFHSNGLEVYLSIIFFVLQIIIDFSAYNDIAMGSAKMFGIAITKNIKDRAYASRSRTELWQNWHISLTSWLRDYIFFPLSKYSKSIGWLYLNILFIYFISGLWHGATWGFILWGIGNGIWLIVENYTKKSRMSFFERMGILKYPSIFSFCCWFVFINASAIFDVFFISKSTQEAFAIFNQLFVWQDFGFLAGKRVLLVILLGLFFLEIVNRQKGELPVYEILPKLIWKRWMVYLAVLLTLFYMQAMENANFYYFKF